MPKATPFRKSRREISRFMPSSLSVFGLAIPRPGNQDACPVVYLGLAIPTHFQQTFDGFDFRSIIDTLLVQARS